MKFWILFVLSGFLFSCEYTNQEIATDSKPNYQTSDSNLVTKAKIQLGKKLFFDPNLSKNKNISCSSCHIPKFAFSDTTKFSVGTNGKKGFRNSPSILNTTNKKLFHKDGGVRTLELQVLSPIIDTNEMGGDFLAILDYLNSDSEYLRLFLETFDTVPTVLGLTRSITSYERTLNSSNSPYDLYLNGDQNALTESQILGMELFNSKKLNCTACHSGRLFTNYTYQNIGLEPQFEDSGRARITFKPMDAGKFEVPSLRNVAITAPYMHNGSIPTLRGVIQYFENGGGTHPNKSSIIKSFSITRNERENLILFLESLTDKQFSE